MAERLLDQIIGWGRGQQQKTKAFSKSALSKLEVAFNEAKRALVFAREERARLEGRLLEREEIRGMIREEIEIHREAEELVRQTFAMAASSEPRTSIRIPKNYKQTQHNPKQILVKIKDGDTDEREVNTRLKQALDPRTMNVNIKRSFKVKTRMVLEVESKSDVARIEAANLAAQGLKVKKRPEKKPTLLIYDIEVGRDTAEVLDEIYERNLQDCGLERDAFDNGFSLRYAYKQKFKGKPNGKENWIVETNGTIREMIKARERLYIGWESYRARDYLDIPRCYKCQKYGHVAKYCSNQTVCGRCAEDHETRNCNANEDQVRCACSSAS